MAQLDLGQDIIRSFLRRAGELLPTDASGEANADHYIDAKLFINEAYWWLCSIRPWRWARKRVQFVSIAETTGSVTTISGSTVTLGATITATKAGYKFILDSEGIPHRISAHTAGTGSLTLETAYTGEQTSGTFTIYQDELTVASDILSFPRITELHLGDNLKLVSETELLAISPRNTYGTTRANYAAFISDSKIRIVPWTSDAHLFECSYNYRPDPLTFDGVAGTDTPILPRDSRIAILQKALEKLYSDKRDARLTIVKAELKESLVKMSAVEATFAKVRTRIPSGHRVSD